MRKHFKFSPSASSRLLACPGSLDLCGKVPQRAAGIAADEGTLAHAVCEALVLGDPIDEFTKHELFKPEIEEHARAFADLVNEVRMHEHFKREWVEVTLEHSQIKDLGGTADYIARCGNEVHILDFKYGKHVAVDAIENTQLLCYALLVDDFAGPFERFTATIHQPRVRKEAQTWEFDRKRLMTFRDELLGAIKRSDFVPGDHCKWCPALAHCSTLQETLVQLSGQELVEGDHERWEQIMALAPAIKALLTEVPKKMLNAMKAGVQFERYKPVEWRGYRTWAMDEEEVYKTLRERRIAKKHLIEEKLKSPTQLEKEGFGEVTEDLVIRPLKGHVVAHVTDKREPVSFRSADEEFKDLLVL